MFMFAMYGACWYIKRIIDRSYKKEALNATGTSRVGHLIFLIFSSSLFYIFV